MCVYIIYHVSSALFAMRCLAGSREKPLAVRSGAFAILVRAINARDPTSNSCRSATESRHHTQTLARVLHGW